MSRYVISTEFKPRQAKDLIKVKQASDNTPIVIAKSPDVFTSGALLRIKHTGHESNWLGWEFKVKNGNIIEKDGKITTIKITGDADNKIKLVFISPDGTRFICVNKIQGEGTNGSSHNLVFKETLPPHVLNIKITAKGKISFLVKDSNTLKIGKVLTICNLGKGWTTKHSIVYKQGIEKVDPAIDNNHTPYDHAMIISDEFKILVVTTEDKLASLVVTDLVKPITPKRPARVIYEFFDGHYFYNWAGKSGNPYNVRKDVVYPDFWDFFEDCFESGITGFRIAPCVVNWGSFHQGQQGGFLIKSVGNYPNHTYIWGTGSKSPQYDELFIARLELLAKWLKYHGMELHLDMADQVQFHRNMDVWNDGPFSKYANNLNWCIAPEACRHGQGNRSDPKHQFFSAFKDAEEQHPERQYSTKFRDAFYIQYVDKLIEILRPYRDIVYLRDGNEVESSSYSRDMCHKLKSLYPNFAGVGSNNEWLYSPISLGNDKTLDINHRNFGPMSQACSYFEAHSLWPDNATRYMEFLSSAFYAHRTKTMLSTDGSGMGKLGMWRKDEHVDGSRPSFNDLWEIIKKGWSYNESQFFGLSVKTLGVNDMRRLNSEFRKKGFGD